jgi:hypothetical protein
MIILDNEQFGFTVNFSTNKVTYKLLNENTYYLQ